MGITITPDPAKLIKFWADLLWETDKEPVPPVSVAINLAPPRLALIARDNETETMYQAIKRVTLDQVNALRGEYGKASLAELPRGYQRSLERCPIAMALRDLGPVKVSRHISIDHHMRRVSGEMCAFMESFDAGMYPELIAGPTLDASLC